MQKNYIGFIRDHTGSMSRNARPALLDYNTTISAVREAAIANSQDTIVTVLRCGIGSPAKNEFETVNSNVLAVQPLEYYPTTGSSTPLWDSIGMMIESLEKVPDAAEETVSFLVQVFTDGDDNSSRYHSATSIGKKIQELQALDRWTFVFRVPKGGRRTLEANGIHPGNIFEWDVNSSSGLATSTAATQQAFQSFYAARSAGAKSTTTFYANLNEVKPAEVKAALVDVSSEVSLWPISAADQGIAIKEFVERKVGHMQLGAAFYQLSKSEKAVQEQKRIAIRDKATGAVYSGAAARQMLGLPTWGSVKLAPGDHGNYEIFIQSTSVNRKLQANTSLLYWPNVR